MVNCSEVLSVCKTGGKTQFWERQRKQRDCRREGPTERQRIKTSTTAVL